MGRFKENDLPKSKITASSLNKAKIIFKYAGKNRWKFYVGLVFLLLTSVTALAFPKFMGMLVDCVNKKDSALANQIALGLGLVLILQSVFSFFRFIGGIGVGASSVAAPIYISEISNAKNRGKLVALFQFNIVFGILIAFFSNYLLEGFDGNNDWRWMLGVEAIPALLFCVVLLKIAESPRWLILIKKDSQQGLRVLEKIYTKEEATIIFKEIENDISVSNEKNNLFSKKYKFPILLAFLLAFFRGFSSLSMRAKTWV